MEDRKQVRGEQARWFEVAGGRWVTGVMIGVLVVMALGACAAAPPQSPPGPSEAEIRAFAAKGYASVAVDQAAAHRSLQDYWMLDGASMAVSLSMPILAASAQVPVPVVIYLPGLGETSEAGERWRDAWTHAGYAVMSVQLSDMVSDESPTLVKQIYSADSMGQRLRRSKCRFFR
jgi:hypothetical protein